MHNGLCDGKETLRLTEPWVRWGCTVHVRPKVRQRGRCRWCGELAGWYDRGDGAGSWRHLDAGYPRVEIVAVARRVGCSSWSAEADRHLSPGASSANPCQILTFGASPAPGPADTVRLWIRDV